jgi:hypothetical protein
MSYEWSLDPQQLFNERYVQMVNTGFTVADIGSRRCCACSPPPQRPDTRWAKQGSLIHQAKPASLS